MKPARVFCIRGRLAPLLSRSHLVQYAYGGNSWEATVFYGKTLPDVVARYAKRQDMVRKFTPQTQQIAQDCRTATTFSEHNECMISSHNFPLFSQKFAAMQNVFALFSRPEGKLRPGTAKNPLNHGLIR